jgi:hypothetical protein
VLQVWFHNLERVFDGVAWPDLGGWGCYNLVSELQFSTLSLDGPCKWKLKQTFQRELLSKWKKLEFQNVHECQEGTESTLTMF